MGVGPRKRPKRSKRNEQGAKQPRANQVGERHLAKIPGTIVKPFVDPIFKKYGIPDWVKPYVYEYLSEEIQSNPIAAIKRAASFIEIGRKKGIITKSYVLLPNGVKFDMGSIAQILGLFLYGEERISQISDKWASDALAAHMPDYARHFKYLAEKDSKHARAIKNLLSGLGKRPGEMPKQVISMFDFIEGIKDWNERIITSSITLNQPYSIMGTLLYRTFYPASSEFMRNFGKAMGSVDDEEAWGVSESARILSSEDVDKVALIGHAEDLLARVHISIDSKMALAKKAGIAQEIKLLRDISILYPLHTFMEMGVSLDMNSEMEAIRKKAESYKSLSSKALQ